MEEKIGYTKTFETKILRVKHLIIFRVGTSKIDLMEMLKDVPDKAVVDEVLEDLGSPSELSSIQFHEEKITD
jgi:hypothetical protein